MSDNQQAQAMTRKELEAKIIAKAWTDEDFRQKFLADPKGQFEEHLGTRLPDTLVMTAHQEDANHLYFVIPAKPQVDLDELSDEDLEKVAGGIDVFVTLGVVLVSVGASMMAATAVASLATAVNTVASLVGTLLGGWGKK